LAIVVQISFIDLLDFFLSGPKQNKKKGINVLSGFISKQTNGFGFQSPTHTFSGIYFIEKVTML